MIIIITWVTLRPRALVFGRQKREGGGRGGEERTKRLALLEMLFKI